MRGSKVPEAIMCKLRNGCLSRLKTVLTEIRMTDDFCSENPGSLRIVDATAKSDKFDALCYSWNRMVIRRVGEELQW